jgi:hypothetical protein
MRRILVVPVLMVALAVTVACGKDSGDRPTAKGGGSASAAGSFQEFVKCMREHGQNLPDADPDSGNVAITPPAGADSAGWNAAMRACQQFMPGGGQGDPPDQQELEALRQFAACMREHGVETTDPDPNTGKSQFGGRFANMRRNEILNDPTYQAADLACRDKLPSPEPAKKEDK